MHPLLLKYGLPVLGGVLVVGALYGSIAYYGHTKYKQGKAEIQALWDADLKTWQEEFDAQVKAKEAAEVEAAAVLKEREDEWKAEKEGLVADARSTARRLRLATTRPSVCAVSGDAGAGGGTGGTGEESGVAREIERLVEEIGDVSEEHAGNCADDAARLTRLQEKWEEVRRALVIR